MDRNFTGVRARGNSIVLDFTFRGARCRETLRTKPTLSALKEAARMRSAALHAIAMGNFEYENHFPNSPNAIKYSTNKGNLITISAALKQWMKISRRNLELSTIRGYESVIYHHLIPSFGHLTLTELTTAHISEWIQQLDISNKRINNILSPLRLTYKDNFNNGTINKNLLERVPVLSVKQKEPKPLKPSEMKKVLQQLSGQAHNLIQFAFWTGLRTSELIGLRWEDIDFENNRFYVRVAIVNGNEKAPKTTSGSRTVRLNDHSLASLQSQLTFTENNLRVFNDPKTNTPWSDHKKSDGMIRKRIWMPALEKACVDYRKPYITRHTFASMMLSNGENPMWVAHQMGHKDWGMIRKVYGKWIPDEINELY